MENLNNSTAQEKLIDIEKAYELWDWAAKFKVSAEALKKAVQAVGKSPKAVKAFLKR